MVFFLTSTLCHVSYSQVVGGNAGLPPEWLINPVVTSFENIPAGEDVYDGLNDGKETHIHTPGDFMRTGMVKVGRLDEDCHSAYPYRTVFIDDFEGDALNLDYWNVGYGGPAPNNLAHTENTPFWGDPSMVRVYDGSLHLLIKQVPAGERWRDVAKPNGEIIQQERNYMAGVVSSRNEDLFMMNTHSASGCYRQGKFTMRAKLPRPRAAVAFWFYGWPGEIDQLELCNVGDPTGCTAITTFHQWNLKPCNEGHTLFEALNGLVPGCPEGNPHLVLQGRPALPNNPYDSFHEYALEWEDDKITWYFDGNVVFEVYRFYRLEPSVSWSPVYGLRLQRRQPVRCSDIPKGVPLTDIYEALWWDRFEFFPLSLILNGATMGWLNPLAIPTQEDFAIDWIKVEQRFQEGYGIEGGEYVCLGAESLFSLTGGTPADALIDWKVSDNLTIAGESGGNLTITALTAGDGFVEARLFTPGNCLPAMIRKPIQILNEPLDVRVVEHIPCEYIRLEILNADPDLGEIKWDITMPPHGRYEVLERGAEVYIPYDLAYHGTPNNIHLDPIPYTVTQETPCGDLVSGGLFEFIWDCENDYELQVWPNPTSGPVQYTVYKDGEVYSPASPLWVELVNNNMEVRASQQTMQTNAHPFVVPSTLPAGEYYLRTVIDGQTVVSGKIIKQ